MVILVFFLNIICRRVVTQCIYTIVARSTHTALFIVYIVRVNARNRGRRPGENIFFHRFTSTIYTNFFCDFLFLSCGLSVGFTSPRVIITRTTLGSYCSSRFFSKKKKSLVITRFAPLGSAGERAEPGSNQNRVNHRTRCFYTYRERKIV